MIELKKDINTRNILKNENPNKVGYIVEKILDFNKQQKGKRLLSDLAPIARIASKAKVSDHYNLKILTPKQMLQRLPIALAQIKTDNTSVNLLNKIRQIMYFLYQ